jgi:Acetyl-CoA dehydrogenase C-terminal like/Acyl-CoA dehydrogenase, C-terminal domain
VGTLVGGVHEGIRQMFLIIENARMMVGSKAIETLSTSYLNALDYAKTRVQGPDLSKQTDKSSPRVTIIHHPDVRRMLMLQKAYAEGLRALVLYTATQQDAVQLATASGTSDEAAAARNDLLLPLVKGVGSERAYEMLTLSLQTLGGSGFLQDYPIEQYIRDAKIDSLYEGTTAIQSLDFFFRKLIRDQGTAAKALFTEITSFAAAESDASPIDASPIDASTAGAGLIDAGPIDASTAGAGLIDASPIDASTAGAGLKAERAALADAVGQVEAMITAMTGFAIGSLEQPQEVYKVGLSSVRLLLAFGDLLIAWLLTRQAEVALRALDSAEPLTEPDRDFYTGKVAAARFFTATVLPRLESDRKIIEQTSNDLMEIPEGAF